MCGSLPCGACHTADGPGGVTGTAGAQSTGRVLPRAGLRTVSAGGARAEGRFMGSVSMDRAEQAGPWGRPGSGAAGAVDGGCGCVTFGGDEVFRVGGELPSLRVVSQRAVLTKPRRGPR